MIVVVFEIYRGNKRILKCLYLLPNMVLELDFLGILAKYSYLQFFSIFNDKRNRPKAISSHQIKTFRCLTISFLSRTQHHLNTSKRHENLLNWFLVLYIYAHHCYCRYYNSLYVDNIVDVVDRRWSNLNQKGEGGAKSFTRSLIFWKCTCYKYFNENLGININDRDRDEILSDARCCFIFVFCFF